MEARRYYDYTKWSREIEAEYKRKKDETAAALEPTASSSSADPDAKEQSKGKKNKLVHLECEALGTDLNRNYGMVSTELKKGKKRFSQTL